jgi:hypothetical protein
MSIIRKYDPKFFKFMSDYRKTKSNEINCSKCKYHIIEYKFNIFTVHHCLQYKNPRLKKNHGIIHHVNTRICDFFKESTSI